MVQVGYERWTCRGPKRPTRQEAAAAEIDYEKRTWSADLVVSFLYEAGEWDHVQRRRPPYVDHVDRPGRNFLLQDLETLRLVREEQRQLQKEGISL